MQDEPSANAEHEAVLAKFQTAMANYDYALRRAFSTRRLTFAAPLNWLEQAEVLASNSEDPELITTIADAHVFILVSAAMECQKQALHSGNIWDVHDVLTAQMQLCCEKLRAHFHARDKELPQGLALIASQFVAEARQVVLREKRSPSPALEPAIPSSPDSGATLAVFNFSGATDPARLNDLLRLMAEIINVAPRLGRIDISFYRDEGDIWRMVRDAVDNARFTLVWFLDSENSPVRLAFKQSPFSWAKAHVYVSWAVTLLTTGKDTLSPRALAHRAAVAELLATTVTAIQQRRYATSKAQLKTALREMQRRGLF